MVSYRFLYCNYPFLEKNDQFTILADLKIWFIKVLETYQFSGRPNNLCQLPEMNYFYKK